MRASLAVLSVGLVCLGVGLVGATAHGSGSTYDISATAIEGCSCPMFCSCYYNTEPTGGHMCRFNNAYQLADGSHWGDVDLSGARIWMSGDLGGDFGDGAMDWVVVTFDDDLSQEQRDALSAWTAKAFPVQWGRMETREDDISWSVDDQGAHAAMASGTAEVQLERVRDPNGEQAIVLNTPYWGTDSNDGFELAYSTHEFNGEPSFSFEKRNGFIITVHSKGTLE